MILQSAPVSWAFMVIATTVVKIALAIPETMEVIQTPSSCHMGVRRARDTMGNTSVPNNEVSRDRTGRSSAVKKEEKHISAHPIR